MIPHDYHLHSNFSCDGQATMDEMCRAAAALGIPEIGFAEHYDLHPADEYRDWFRLEPWAAALERCRDKYAGQLIIRAGIEIGEPHLYGAEAQAMLGRYPFDFVVGSLHWVGAESIFDRAYYERRPADEAFGLYFEELERMTQAGGFDVLGHFDVVARAGRRVYGRYDARQYEAAIRPALRNCVERGLALDVNTKSLRTGAETLTPGPAILRWYAEMGGERITLGSDAHRPDNVGADFGLAMGAARAAGLDRVTQFAGRQAKLIPMQPSRLTEDIS